MLSAYYIYCIYSNALQTAFIMEASSMNPDQTAPFWSSLIWVHIAYLHHRLPKYVSRWESRPHLLWMVGIGLICLFFLFVALFILVWIWPCNSSLGAVSRCLGCNLFRALPMNFAGSPIIFSQSVHLSVGFCGYKTKSFLIWFLPNFAQWLLLLIALTSSNMDIVQCRFQDGCQMAAIMTNCPFLAQ